MIGIQSIFTGLVLSQMTTTGAAASEPPATEVAAVQAIDLAAHAGRRAAPSAFDVGGGVFSPGNVLYDNGISFLNGLSNFNNQGVWRRSVIDDFVVPEGEVWAISSLHLKGAQSDGQGGAMNGFEIDVYGDGGGEPDFDTHIAIAQNVTITQMNDPADPDFFTLDVWDITADFDTIELGEGTYWVDMFALIDINWFQVIGPYPQKRGAPCWVHYDDFGGRVPCFSIFGDDYDVNFVVAGEVRSPVSSVSSFNIELGRYVSGTVFNLWSSDDSHLVIEQRLGISPLLPVIRVIVIGETTIENVSELTFLLEASATGLPATIPQSIDLFNYDGGFFEPLDSSIATLSDSVRTVTVDTDAQRFVEAAGQLRARLNWFDPGGLFTPAWSAKIDHVEWTVRP